MRQKVEIEVDVPDGWRAVAYRPPVSGEWYLHSPSATPSQTGHTWLSSKLILERIEPKRESRWFNAFGPDSGYPSRGKANLAACDATRQGIIRHDFEDGKLVAVTLEPEGEVRDE